VEIEEDATSEFEIRGFTSPVGWVEIWLKHKPCSTYMQPRWIKDEEFTCLVCRRRYKIAEVYPLKIVEVK
jgi:hypothetical protein